MSIRFRRGSGALGTSTAFWQFTRLATVLFFAVLSGYAADTDSKIDPSLLKALSEARDSVAPFFVVFSERADVKPAMRITDRAARGRFVVGALQAVAERTQAGVRGYLSGQRVAFTPFWVENKIYVPGGTLDLARELARRPEVAAILPEVIYAVPEPEVTTTTSTPQWNITKIKADQVAAIGAGIVVANIDTGVQFDHPALVNQYRGNNGGVFGHVGNWKDPTNTCTATPCDNNGHGTHTMGTMVGDNGTTRYGVAPGAKWIACKGCASGSCASAALTSCAQWVLDPLGNNSGNNQPDVVNNSWGGGSGTAWYQSYIQNWRAAGIFPAFSNGNDGPNCGTSGSPGDYPDSFSSGATSSSDVIASFSSRGPSAFGGIKPDISAPGVSIVSSIPGSSYGSKSGTSMASPHTAGAVALLWSAASSYRANIAGTETLLTGSAFPIGTTETCGGLTAGAIPNNTFGYGRLDVLAAVNAALANPANQPPSVNITAPANGASYTCPATVNITGTASDPEQGDLSSSIEWIDSGVGSLGAGNSVSRTYDCTTAGNHIITARVTDNGGSSDTDSITISIVYPPNDGYATATIVNPAALPYANSVTTASYTTDTGDPTPSCGNGSRSKSAWYKFTPTVTGTISADTIGSNYNTILAAYTGGSGSFAQVDCNDDFSGTQSKVSFVVTAGVTYSFMITDFSGAGGSLIFHLSYAPPSNDDWASAKAASVPYTDTVNTVYATIQTSDPTPGCVSGNRRDRSVWYKFTPASPMTLIADTITAGTTYDTILSVWTGSPGSFVQVACNDDFVGLWSQVTFSASAGVTYYFMISSYSGTGGGMTFHLTSPTKKRRGQVTSTSNRLQHRIGGGNSDADSVRRRSPPPDVAAEGAVTASDQTGSRRQARDHSGEPTWRAVKDQEVIAAADRLGLAMVFSGVRHFRH